MLIVNQSVELGIPRDDRDTPLVIGPDTAPERCA